MTFTTLIILVSEGDTKFIYSLKLVATRKSMVSGAQFVKVSKCQKLSMQTLFGFLVLRDAPGVSGANRKEEKRPLWTQENQLCTLWTPQGTHLIFLKSVVNEHGSGIWYHLVKKNQPSLIMGVDKIVRGLGTSSTSNNWDNQCSFSHA